MKFVFLGDYFPQVDVRLGFDVSDIDLTFINLEAPTTSSKKMIKKAGPNIKGNSFYLEKFVSQFQGRRIFFNLANNHIGDFGEEGIRDTITKLNSFENVFYAGVSEKNEIIPTIIEDLGIAVISICERQFGISQLHKLGATYFTPSVYNKIIELKKKKYKIVVSTHCAEEMFIWPSPRTRAFFKSLIDVGADIVYNTHSHVPSGYEYYREGVIMYGMGNFVCDVQKWSHMKNTTVSLMMELSDMQLSCKWLAMRDDKVQISKEIENYISDCVSPFSSDEKLESIWQEYSIRKYNDLYKNWLNPSFFTKMKRLLKSLFRKDLNYYQNIDLLLKYHLWANESHRQVIECALGVLSGEIEDLRDFNSRQIVDKYYQ